MTAPTFVSLFSGIGGLDLGLERAGWRCVAQVEVDPFCQRVLARHWPEVPRWGDIREVDPDELPRADLVCGGFPCQPVSVAGRGRAQEDERWLWPEAARLVRDLRPRWVLLENVPGLLVRGMGDVLGDLAACGYDAEWDVIPAAAVSAPHLRERVFVVAYPAGHGLQRQLHEPQRQHDPLGWGEQPEWNGPDRQMADPDSQGRHQRFRPFGDGRRWPQPSHRGWWAAEPDVGRVAHGVPARLDRLRSLGNAVVPQVAEHVGRLILAAHREAVT